METKDNRGVGDRITDLMKVYGLTVNSFASKIGGSTAKYYKLINGKSRPDFETLFSVLDKFPDVSAEWLLRGEGPMRKEDLVSKDEAFELKAENKALQNLLIKSASSMGKTKGASNHPQADREGASELLDKVRGKNIKAQNTAYLATYVLNPCRQ